MAAYKELVTVSWLCITYFNFCIVIPNMHVWWMIGKQLLT